MAVMPTKESREVSLDAALARRLLRKDVGAFEQIYKRHGRIVYSLVLRILREEMASVLRQQG